MFVRLTAKAGETHLLNLNQAIDIFPLKEGSRVQFCGAEMNMDVRETPDEIMALLAQPPANPPQPPCAPDPWALLKALHDALEPVKGDYPERSHPMLEAAYKDAGCALWQRERGEG